jgi:hypothetical protein
MTAPISQFAIAQDFLVPFDFTGKTALASRQGVRGLILDDLDIGRQLPVPLSTTYFEGALFLQDSGPTKREDLGGLFWAAPITLRREKPATAVPLRNADLDEDDRWKPLQIDPEPAFRQCDPANPIATVTKRAGQTMVRQGPVPLRSVAAELPGGHPGIVLRGSEELAQHLQLFPAWTGVLSANHRGDKPPGRSTLVADLKGEEYDAEWTGGLETAVKIQSGWRGRCPVSLFWGFLPARPDVGCGLFTGHGEFGGGPEGMGLASAAGGGPIYEGPEGCPHLVGFSKDGKTTNQGHLYLKAPWWNDPLRDAPPEVDLPFYEPPSSGGVPWRTVLRFDPTLSHRKLGLHRTGGLAPGLFRWETFIPFFIPDPPRKPPPKKPPPPPEDQPLPPLPPPPPFEPKPDQDLRLPPLGAPSTPGALPVPGPLKEPIPPDANDIDALIQPLRPEPHGAPSSPGSGPIAVPPVGLVPIPGGTTSAPPEGEPPEPIDEKEFLDEDRKLGIRSSLWSWLELGVTSMALRPRHLQSTDLRYCRSPDLERLRAAEEDTPFVGRVDVIGAQRGDAYRFTQAPGSRSRYARGTASGAFVLMPPEYDLDFLRGTVPLPTIYSRTYLTLWNTCLALGEPIPTGPNGGGIKNGWTAMRSSTDLILNKHDAAGAPTRHFAFLGSVAELRGADSSDAAFDIATANGFPTLRGRMRGGTFLVPLASGIAQRPLNLEAYGRDTGVTERLAGRVYNELTAVGAASLTSFWRVETSDAGVPKGLEVLPEGNLRHGHLTSGATMTVDATALTVARTAAWQDASGTVAYLADVTAAAGGRAGYLSGCQARYQTASQVAIAAGLARSSDDTFDLVVTATLTVDITVAGAGGLDAGAEAADTWYAVYVIGDSTLTNPTVGLLSTAFESPTLPAGYDKQRRVGSVRNNAASNFIEFQINGVGKWREVEYLTDLTTRQILSAGSAIVLTTISAASLVPPRSTEALLFARETGNRTANLRRAGTAANLRDVRAGESFQLNFPLSPAQELAYFHALGGGTRALDLYIDGFVEEL